MKHGSFDSRQCNSQSKDKQHHSKAPAMLPISQHEVINKKKFSQSSHVLLLRNVHVRQLLESHQEESIARQSSPQSLVSLSLFIRHIVLIQLVIMHSLMISVAIRFLLFHHAPNPSRECTKYKFKQKHSRLDGPAMEAGVKRYLTLVH